MDLLHGSGRVELAALFGPEHGVRGEAQAGDHVGDARDARTGLPVHSLYGATLAPTPEMLEGLEAILFDIQDVGARYATYVSTMAGALEAASDAGLLFVVLDRPNPTDGVHIEGPGLAPGYESFVGAHPVPVRHGTTCGELAKLIAAVRGLAPPVVVPMRGWRRSMWYDETGLPWVQPTPNLPTLDSLTLYPGTCLLEGSNVSEGRGTTRPFEVFGAPWIEPYALAEDLARRRLPGAVFRPVWFTPAFSKHAGSSCGGVQAHIVDRDALHPVELGVHVLHSIKSLYPQAFEWRTGDERYFVDLLYGDDSLRTGVDAGESAEELVDGWATSNAEFTKWRRSSLLYE
ncbi:MAG: DUF1343 domain-containing protein [Chloroflexia bacterium]